MTKISNVSDRSPAELRQLAESFRQSANRLNNGFTFQQRQLLWRNAYNLERIADYKAKKSARQNRHPEHTTVQ